MRVIPDQPGEESHTGRCLPILNDTSCSEARCISIRESVSFQQAKRLKASIDWKISVFRQLR
jgi:hypothetical protein